MLSLSYRERVTLVEFGVQKVEGDGRGGHELGFDVAYFESF